MNRSAPLQLASHVRDVLNREWDPIGDCPEGEYASYANRMASLILRGAGDDDLLAYLKSAEEEDLGFALFDRGRALKVIAALRALPSRMRIDNVHRPNGDR